MIHVQKERPKDIQDQVNEGKFERLLKKSIKLKSLE